MEAFSHFHPIRGASPQPRTPPSRFRWYSILGVGCLLALALPFLRGAKNAGPESLLSALEADRLEAGDLIFVRGATWRGQAVMWAEKDFPYSHLGILCGTAGNWTVVHASPYETEGRTLVQNQPLAEFLDDPKVRAAAIYRLSEKESSSPANARLASEAALRIQKADTPFDFEFDLESGEAVYCTELVWRAFTAAGIDLCEGNFDRVSPLFLRHPVILPSSLLRNHAFTCIQKIRQP